VGSWRLRPGNCSTRRMVWQGMIVRVQTANLAWGQAMPAVELIQVGDAYAVRDGHHCIPVVRALGEDYFNAQVTDWELVD